MDKFSALSDPTRRKIIEMLANSGPMSATDICEQFKVSPPAISQHLKVLREVGLLDGKKHGYFMHYDVNRAALLSLSTTFEEMAAIQREPCDPEDENCKQKRREMCHSHRSDEQCPDEVRHACHGDETKIERHEHGHCKHQEAAGGQKE